VLRLDSSCEAMATLPALHQPFCCAMYAHCLELCHVRRSSARPPAPPAFAVSMPCARLLIGYHAPAQREIVLQVVEVSAARGARRVRM